MTVAQQRREGHGVPVVTRRGGHAGVTVVLVAVLGTWLLLDGGVGARSSLAAMVRAAEVVAACGAVGCLAVGALLARTPTGDGEGAEATTLVRSGARWAVLWAVTACCSLGLLVAQAGAAPGTAGTHAGIDAARAVEDGVHAGVVTAWAAATLAVTARSAGRRRAVVACLVLGYAALVPSLLVGHAGHADARLLSVAAASVHVMAAVTWVGGLMALVTHRVAGARTVTSLEAFSRVALACFLAVGLSGALGVAARADGAEVTAGTYGALLAGKVCGLGVLGLCGAAHRARTIRRVTAGRAQAFWVLVAGELVVMAAVVAAAVVLSRTAA